ncbi:MAG: hypothetical protein AXW17_12070 [Colwellia sp. Phe_37]|jgi:hypothetical protein|nr:MAG: hypothetical protein AXW17_12070 [Colwellia sp. Phe_37]|tara:strand:+ start:38773 stop:39273 length:501 start_codon:yes stop_codon:yes gene_type:complete
MKRYILVISLLLLTNIAFCSSNDVEESLEVNDLVFSFLDELNQLKIKGDELYINKVSEIYKSSHWVNISQEEKKTIDIEFANMPFINLSGLHGGKVVHSKKANDVACVFVYKQGVVGAFSLVNEDGWKFMSPSIYFSDQNIPKVCSALGFELGIKNDDLIHLKENY